jgi:hypothetical protein
MAPIIEGPPEGKQESRRLSSRLLWFVALWVGGAAATAAVAYALRAFIVPS